MRACAEGGDSGGSAAGGKNPRGGVIRPTAMMPSQVTPAMMAEFMAKFGSMQAMASKIEQLEAKVADMKLVRGMPCSRLTAKLLGVAWPLFTWLASHGGTWVGCFVRRTGSLLPGTSLHALVACPVAQDSLSAREVLPNFTRLPARA